MAANPKFLQEKPLEGRKNRQSFIGASEIGAVLGLSKWKTPVDVYFEKIADEPVIVPMNDAMEMGLRIEEIVAQKYADDTESLVMPMDESIPYPEKDFIRVSPDRKAINPKTGEALLVEIKTISGMYRRTLEDEIPLEHYCQLQWQMAVTGIHQGEIALLVDGRKFEIIPFEYSQGFIDKSLPVLEAFWSQHVLKRIPPPPIKLKDMVKLYPDSNDAVEMVSDEVLANYEELISVREQLKVYESREAELKLSIQDYMKQSDTLVDGERVLCTWKTSTSRRFNQKRFAADYPELFQEYKDDSSQRRFLPKTPKK